MKVIELQRGQQKFYKNISIFFEKWNNPINSKFINMTFYTSLDN